MRFPTNTWIMSTKFARRHAGPRLHKVAVVGATNTGMQNKITRYQANNAGRWALNCILRSTYPALLFIGGLVAPVDILAVVLPEARTDRMYHYYSGGDDVTVHGPAALTRINASDNVAVSARYYMDMISSASPDVVSAASRVPYTDQREEFGLGVDLLHGNSLVQFTLSTSDEKDYEAKTFNLNTSHDLFGGLTTVNLGYGQGHDQVEQVNTSFEAEINRHNYRLGLTQVVARDMLLGVSYEGIAEEGYLGSPYRSARILGAARPEIYPETRDSQAFAVRFVQGFPSSTRAVGSSLRAEHRYFRDNWGIRSNTLSLAYQQYFGRRWLGELRYRYYQQSAASFYSDNFAVERIYMARDKELSTFHSHSLGAKASWQFLNSKYLFLERASLNFSHDYIYFDYQDYTNVLTGELHAFGAHVFQFYISAWY